MNGHRQSGVALVSVLMIFSIVTVLAVGLAKSNQKAIEQTDQFRSQQQAYEYALGAEDYIRMILIEDRRKTGNIDHLNEFWAKGPYHFKPPMGDIKITVKDLNGRFDINSLVDGNGKIDDARLKQFSHLLKSLSVDPKLGLRMADWLDKDDSPRTDQSEKSDLKPGSPLPPNRRLDSVYQLRGVHGLDNKSWHRLSQYIAARPLPLRYNPNTASNIVYAAKQNKSTEPSSSPVSRNRKPSKGGTSDWFDVDIQVDFNGYQLSMKSTIFRESKKSAIVVSRDLTPTTEKKTPKFTI